MRTDLLPATVVLVLPVFALAIQDQLDTAANYPPQVPSGEEIDLNKRGYGSLCEKDDDCFIGRGLACVGSRCNCSTKNPLRIRDSTGIPTCLKAKAIYEACTYDEECVRGSENLKCVDYLCYCSLPFILRDDMQCVAARPPMLRTLVAVVPTVFLLFIIFILGGTYIYQRLFHHQEPGVRREPSGEPESQQGSAEAVAKRSYTGSNAIKLQNTNLSGIYRQFLRSAQASHSRESVSAASRPTPGFLATPKAVRDQPRGASFSPTYFKDVISSSTEEDLTEVKVCRGDAENPPGADDPIPLMLAKKILGASLLNSITSSEEVVVKVETKAKEAVDKGANKAEKRPKKVEEKRRQSESKKGAVEVTHTEKFSCVLDKGKEHRSQHVGDVSPPTKLSRAAPPPQAEEAKKTSTVRRLPSSDAQRDHVEPELYEGTHPDLTMTPTLPLREKNTLGIGTPFVDTEDPLPESESVGLSFLSLASSHEVLPKPDIQSKSFRARLSEENRVHQGSHSLDDGKLRFCRFSPLDVEFDLNLLPSLSNDPYSAEHYLEVVHEEEIADGQSTENVREVDPVTAQSSVRTAPQLPTENRGGTTEGRTVGGATDKNGSYDPIQTATAPVNVAEQETVAEKSAGTGRKSSKVISAKTVKPETAREPEVLVPDIGNKAKQTILPESPSCPSKPEIPTVKDSEKRRGPLRSSASGVEQQDDVRRLLRLTSPLADGGAVKREDSASRRTGRRGAVVQLPTMATVDEESTQRPECSSKIERNLGAVQDVRTTARKSPEPPESLDSAKGKSSKTPVTAKTTLSSAQTAVPDKDFRRNVGNARGPQKPLRQQKSLRAGPFRLTGSISRLPKVEEGHPLTSIEQDDVRPDVHTSRILLGSRISNPSVDAGVGRASSLSLRRFSPMPVSPTTSAKGRAGRPGSRRLLRSSSTALNKSSLKLARSRRDIAATFGEAIQALKRKSSKPLKEEVDTGASDHVPSSSTTQRTERKSDKTDADEDLAKEIQDAVRTGSTSSGSHDITEALTKIKVAMMGNEHYRRERNVLQRPSARATPSENRPSIPTGVALNETQYILQYDINFRRQQRRSSEAICTRSPSPTRNCRPVPGVEFSPRPSTPPSEVFVSKNMAGVCDVSPSFIKSLLDQELIQVSPLPLKEIIRLRYPHMTPIIARKKNASSSKTTSKHQRSSILATLNEASTSHTNPDSVSCSEFLEQGEVHGKPIPKPRSTSHRMEEKTDEPRPVPRKRNVTSKRANRGRLHLITGNVLEVGPHPVAAFVQPLHLSPKDSFTTIGDTSSTKASRQAKRQKQRRLTAGDSAVERNGDLEVLYDAAITRAEAVGLRSSINSTNLHDETPRTQAAPYNDVVSRRQDVNDSRPSSRTRRRLNPSRHPRRYSSEPHRSSGTISLAAKKQFSEPLRGQLAIIPEVTNEASPTPSTESSYDAISSLDDPSSDSDNTRSSYSTPPRHKPKQPDITLCRKTTNMDNVPKKPKPYSITPTSSAFFTSDTSSYLGASCLPSSLRGKLSDVEVCVRSSVMEGTTTEGVLSIDLGRTTLVNDPSRASSFRKKTMKKIGSRVRDLRRVFEDSSRDVTQKCSSIRDKFGIVSARVNQWRTSKSHPQRDVAPMLVTESHRPLQVQEVEEQVTTFHQMMKALQKSSTSVIAAIGGSSVPSRTTSPRSSPSRLHESASSREWKEPAVEPEPDSSLESFPGHNEPPGRREHLKEKVIAEMGLSDWQRKPMPRTRTKRAPSPRLLSYAVWPGREQPDSSTSFSVLEASDVDSLFAVTSMEGGSKPYQCFGMTASSTSNVPVSRSLHIDTSESEWYSCSDTEHDA